MMNELKQHRRFTTGAVVVILWMMTMTASATATAAVPVSITATVSADSAMVGDELLLDVVITGVPKGAGVIPPDTDKGFGEFAVLGWEDLSAEDIGINAKGKVNNKGKGISGDKDSSRYRYRYGIAAYKPVNCTIPAIPFLVGVNTAGTGGGGIDVAGIGNNGINADSGIDNNSADVGFTVNDGGSVNVVRYDTLLTLPIPIRMLSALPDAPPDSGGFALKDLKGQQNVGRADLWYLWVILGVALAVAAFILLKKYLKRKGAVDAEPAVPLLPPYEEAILAIEKLDGKKYLDKGMVREYVFELSEIFKRYIGRRYDTIAPELTTEEISAWLEFSDISREMRLCAERFFRSSDQVKFAKWVPDRSCIDGYIRDVRMFIEATKPDPTLPYERKTERMGVAQ